MGYLSKNISEISIAGFGFWLSKFGEGLKKQRFKINWMLLEGRSNFEVYTKGGIKLSLVKK